MELYTLEEVIINLARLQKHCYDIHDGRYCDLKRDANGCIDDFNVFDFVTNVSFYIDHKKKRNEMDDQLHRIEWVIKEIIKKYED